MPIEKFTAKLSEKVRLGSKFVFMQFELLSPHRIEFVAGQYLILDLPGGQNKRQYSIVSAPRLNHAVQLLIELIPGGVASTYFDQLETGQQISFFAPAGEFIVREEVEKTSSPLVFIGTGSGIAPLRSMILDQLRTKETTRPLQFFWGMRYVTDIFWLEYFEELKANYPNFSYDITLSRAPEEWKLCRGRVTNCLAIHEISPDAQYYVCGNAGMVTDVTGTLKTRGVSEDHIHFEKFTL